MINLLPDDRKHDIRAARTNVILLRYNIATVGTILLFAASCLGFFAILHNNEQKAIDTNNDNTKKTSSLDKVKTAAADYRNDLTLASKIVGNGISYTDVIVAITKLMPDGAILNGLTLSGTSFGQQISFQADTVSYDVAEQLKQNFQGSTVFTNVFFQELSLPDNPGPATNPYPVTVSMSAKLNNPATFNEK